jgi:hypothetical protein
MRIGLSPRKRGRTRNGVCGLEFLAVEATAHKYRDGFRVADAKKRGNFSAKVSTVGMTVSPRT